jgi:hypothetical protein
MPGITLAQAQEALDAALTAQKTILEGGTMYRRGDRWVELPPLSEVEASITRWQAEVERLAAGRTSRGPRIFGVTPG